MFLLFRVAITEWGEEGVKANDIQDLLPDHVPTTTSWAD